jgi:hypothetical protein
MLVVVLACCSPAFAQQPAPPLDVAPLHLAGSFTPAAECSGMTAGAYHASITVTMEGAASSPQGIPVEVTIK